MPLVPNHRSIVPVLSVGRSFGLRLFYFRLLPFLFVLLLKQLMSRKCLKKNDIFLSFRVFVVSEHIPGDGDNEG